MVETEYKIVFSGEIAPGQDIEVVKNSIAALFKIPVAKCESMFTGRPYTIKTNLDYQTAEKYRQAFERTGAICRIEPPIEQDTQDIVINKTVSQKEKGTSTVIIPNYQNKGSSQSEKNIKKFTIKPYLLNWLTRAEKIAVLKLLIRIASADNVITEEENTKIQEFLQVSNLKMSQEFWSTVRKEDCSVIISVFTNKSSLKRAKILIDEYANYHGVHPDFEGKVLEEITHALDEKKKVMKFSLSYWLNAFIYGFAFLWGQEDIEPKVKKIFAITFTVLACIFGSYWTSSILGFFKTTDIVIPQFSAVISGLFIYGALSVRNYMPRPTNLSNILFIFADVYLLGVFSMHMLG